MKREILGIKEVLVQDIDLVEICLTKFGEVGIDGNVPGNYNIRDQKLIIFKINKEVPGKVKIFLPKGVGFISHNCGELKIFS